MVLNNVDQYDTFLDFIRYFKDAKGREIYLEQLKEMLKSRKKTFYVNYADLYNFDNDLATQIINNPKELLPILEKRLYDEITHIDELEKVAIEKGALKVALPRDPSYQEEVKKIHIRITNIPTTVELRKIRTEYSNKLISIEGVLVKLSKVKQRLVKGTFRHLFSENNHEFEYPQEEKEEFDEILEIPNTCPVCGKAGQFKLIEEKSKFVDWQKGVIQERQEEVPPGQIPRQLEVIFEEDLVDSVRPGDRVKLVGTLELKKESQIKRGSKTIFDFYLKVNSVEVSQKILEEVQITQEEEKKIRELATDPWIRERIILSIAPSIYGHYEIKEAIALALFGGVPKIMEDGTRVRGDTHILIIGDPGTAKSQILQFASRVAPRSIYTTGKGSTTAGLTATVIKDKDTGEYYLEAGALVLADGGVAVIDEIDKMRGEDRDALHEAMEQQTVSIAKAGIVAKLNARTTIISAGNPKFGRYIAERPISDNINLPPTILSRFDLIFILVDNPGEEDSNLANHVLESRDKKHKTSTEEATKTKERKNSSLEEFINKVHKENFEPIDIELLKKYIAYARKNITDITLEPEAKKLIHDFYVDMRRKSAESPDSPIMITPRQLEALIRLSQAYAKMRLSTIATKEDVERAINIMHSFLSTVGLDIESGKMDIDTVVGGIPKNAREKMIRLLEIIKTIGNNGCVKVNEIIKEAEGYGMDKETVLKLLAEMRHKGLVYLSKGDCYGAL